MMWVAAGQILVLDKKSFKPLRLLPLAVHVEGKWKTPRTDALLLIAIYLTKLTMGISFALHSKCNNQQSSLAAVKCAEIPHSIRAE